MLFAVGTYTSLGGPGIALIECHHGHLNLRSATNAVDNPIWLHASLRRPILYVAGSWGEDDQGCVASFAWHENTLTLLSRQETGGASCCHLALDEEETHLYAANYTDGSIAVFPLADGRIQPRCQFLQHAGHSIHPKRQTGPHAHQIVFRPESREVFACDLGADQVVVYRRLENGTLEHQTAIPGTPGTGPRHLVFDGPNRFYLVGELTGWISRYEAEQGQWRLKQILPTVPDGAGENNSAAAVRMDANHVYVSNRGHDSIAVFEKSEDGALRFLRTIPTPGEYPRDFQLQDGGYLLAQQNRGGVAWMDASGALKDALDIPGAVCLCPIPE